MYDDSKFYENPPNVIESSTVPMTDSNLSRRHSNYTPERIQKQEDPKQTSENKKKPKSWKNSVLSLNDKKNKSNIAQLFIEMMLYAIYLIVLIYIAFMHTSSQKYFFTKAISNTFTKGTDDGIDFSNIHEIDDIWHYLNSELLPGLYWDNVVYNISTDGGMVLYENKLLGQPIMRMLKVHNKSCTVPESFAREIKQCFANYEPEFEDKVSFGTSEMLLSWTSEDELGTGPTAGQLATYKGSGFVVELPSDDTDKAYLTLEKLKDMRWIDRGTRAVIIDFALYNVNVNLFTIARLLLELPATGGVLATPFIDTYALFRYNGTAGYILIALEGVFIGFTIFFMVEELIQIIRVKFKYFRSFWNIVDVIIISLSIAAMIVSYIRTNTVSHRLNKIIKSKFTTCIMDDVVSIETTYQTLVSIILFLAWIKVFKYISINRTMSQLSDTLKRSSKDIGGFFVMFAVFFFAYAQFGYLVFGTQIEEYSTFVGAIYALLRIILGDFDYVALERANRVLGPIFFLTYVFFVFFVLLNMFLAIINDSYMEVKSELKRKKDSASLVDWVKSKINRLLKSSKSQHPESPSNIEITYDDYKKELIRAGYNEKDIMDAFTKLDIKASDNVKEEGMDDIADEMNNVMERRKLINDDHRQYIVVNRRIDALQEALSTSVIRLETVMSKIADIEEKKVWAKEQENKLIFQDFLNDTESRQRSTKKLN